MSEPNPAKLTVSDDAKRMCHEIMTHLHADRNNAGQWVAIFLSDGGSDHTAYPSRKDAIKGQLTGVQDRCAYIQIPADSIAPLECEYLLDFYRQAHEKGFNITDPDTPDLQVIPPMFTNELRGARNGRR